MSVSRVSVILPVYNCGRYVNRCLESLASQTLRDFDVIAIDDGSTDETGDILDSFAARDARFKVVHKQNGGLVPALNLGISIANADYLARMDGDDICHPDRLKRQSAYLADNPDCVCVGSLYRTINALGDVTKVQSHYRHQKQTNLSLFPPQVVTPHHPTIMVRAAAMRTIRGYRAQFRHAEDYDMYLRLASEGTFHTIQDYLLDYRLHDEAVSSRHFKEQTENSFLATLAALVISVGKADPTGCSITATRRAYYELLEETHPSMLLEILGGLRLVHASQNRGFYNSAMRVLLRTLHSLAKAAPSYAFDQRFYKLLKECAKSAAKFARVR